MSLLVCLILLCWYWFVFVPWFDWTWSQVLFTFQIRNLLSSTSHHLFEWKYVAWHRGGWYGGGWFMFCFFGWLSVFCFVFPRWLFLYDSVHIIISSSVGKLEVGRGGCLTLRRPVVEAVQRKGPPGDPLIQFTFNIQPIRINNIIIEIINLVSGRRWILKTIHLREMMMTFPGNIRQDPSIFFSYQKFPWCPFC